MFFFFFLHLKRGGRRGFIYLLFFWFFIIIYILLSHFLPPEGGGRVAWVLLFCVFFVLCVSFCYCFFVLLVKKVWVYFSYFILFLIKNLAFFYFLKGERGHKLFKNLLRGEGISLINLFWKKNLLKDGNGLGWVRIFFLRL